MIEFVLKVGATGVPLTVTLKDASGDPVNLTDADVDFFMALPNSAVRKINGAACTVLDQVTNEGGVQYDFSASDADTAGEYDGEFKVTLPSGGIVYYPTDKGQKAYIRIHIQERL